MTRSTLRWGRGLAPLLLVGVLIGYPLAALFIQIVFPHLFSFHPSANPSLQVVAQLLRDNVFWLAVRNSLLLAAAVGLAGTALGTAIGYLLVRARPWRPDLWESALWLLFFAPSFMMAEGVQLFAIPGGVGSALHVMPGWLSQLIFSPIGVGAVLALKLMPYAAITVAGALQNVGQEYDNAARTLGASRLQRLRRVQLPLIRGAISAGFALIFAEAVSDFGVAATLALSAHFALVPYTIYSALSAFPVNFPGAAGQSALLIMLSLLVQLPSLLLARGAMGTMHGHRRPWRKSRTNVAATAFMVLVFIVALGIPLGSFLLVALVPSIGTGLGPAHWTLANFAALFGANARYAGPSLLRSLLYASGAALLTTALGVWVMWAGARLSALYDLLLTATIAVPGIVLASAYVFAWHAPWVQGTPLALYGTSWALLLAYLAGGLPYSARLARVGLAQVDRSLPLAVRSLGGSERTALWRVTLPLIRPLVFSTLMLIFTGVFFELPASELLYPPGQPTLAVAIIHQFHAFQDGIGAALSVCSVAALALVVGGLRWLERRHPQRWRSDIGEAVHNAEHPESVEVLRVETNSA